MVAMRPRHMFATGITPAEDLDLLYFAMVSDGILGRPPLGTLIHYPPCIEVRYAAESQL